MHIKPENIFAVQNCSQKENNEELPLSHVQRLEMEELRHILNENDDIGYGLGWRHIFFLCVQAFLFRRTNN